jgi:hypothetical protein
MIRSTCFGHYYAHHQELATIHMAPTRGTSPWLWQVAGLVMAVGFSVRLGGGATCLYPDAKTYTSSWLDIFQNNFIFIVTIHLQK